MEGAANYGVFERDLINLKATELRLGLPGTDHENEETASASVKNNKRCSSELEHSIQLKSAKQRECGASVPKAQIVGWPPVRSYHEKFLKKKPESDAAGTGMLVKVSMDGAPYLRKIDLNVCTNYLVLLKELESMFKCTIGVYSEREGYINGSEFAPTYEDKDGDWMLVGDVPWDMFITSCKRLRIMKGSEAKGLQHVPRFA